MNRQRTALKQLWLDTWVGNNMDENPRYVGVMSTCLNPPSDELR